IHLICHSFRFLRYGNAHGGWNCIEADGATLRSDSHPQRSSSLLYVSSICRHDFIYSESPAKNAKFSAKLR
ncbi:MAG: hypothetical protein RR075_06800, partial [Pygmaiobacter sp.]